MKNNINQVYTDVENAGLEINEGLEKLAKTYFTAEASGHNFFHISETYPERICDCGIAGFQTLLSQRETP